MSRYKAEKFNFSGMSERLVFQNQNSDGSYTDKITVWAHVLKDGFTRQETDNWFRIMVREQKALKSLLKINNRLKWKDSILTIFSWQDPSYEDRGFIEILCKQVITADGIISSPLDGEIFKDIVSIYRMTKVEVVQYGLTSYEYKYDFNSPLHTDIRCHFSYDRNRYLEDKKKDIEHDSLIVKFSSDVPILKEDYIISPIHGKYKVDMVIKNEENMLEVYVVRSEVQ